MVEAPSALARLVLATRALRSKVERRRSFYMRWLPPQDRFHRCRRRFKLLRMGNQHSGKTSAGLTEVDWRCTGKHPHLKTRRPPILAWVVCDSWSQSVVIQRKFWELCDRDELDPLTVFDDVKGFRGKFPTVRYKNGSIIRFKTGRQGRGGKAAALASDTLDVVLIDEPVEQRVFEECRKRVMRRGGTLLMTLTPINGPVDYLKELCDKEIVEDIHHKLEPQNLVPVGSSEPIRLWDEENGRWVTMDAAWCTALRHNTLSAETPVVVDGEWEMRATDAYFGPVWDADKHIAAINLDGQWDLLLGADHGHRPGKQVILAILVKDKMGARPIVHVFDEYIDETGSATPDDDADGVISMLSRHGWRWHQVDEAHGDRVHMKGTPQQKSNRDLSAAIARSLQVPRDALRPYIETVKRGEGHGAGSLSTGSRWLFHAMSRPGQFTIHPRCKHGIARVPRYNMADDDEGTKDWVDALRYGLDTLIFPTWRKTPGTVRFAP